MGFVLVFFKIAVTGVVMESFRFSDRTRTVCPGSANVCCRFGSNNRSRPQTQGRLNVVFTASLTPAFNLIDKG